MTKYVQGKILRIRDVMDRTGLSRSSIYALMLVGEFPKQAVMGMRAVGWVEDEIHQHILKKLEQRELREKDKQARILKEGKDRAKSLN